MQAKTNLEAAIVAYGPAVALNEDIPTQVAANAILDAGMTLDTMDTPSIFVRKLDQPRRLEEGSGGYQLLQTSAMSYASMTLRLRCHSRAAAVKAPDAVYGLGPTWLQSKATFASGMAYEHAKGKNDGGAVTATWLYTDHRGRRGLFRKAKA